MTPQQTQSNSNDEARARRTCLEISLVTLGFLALALSMIFCR